jgi:hypothetical protein
MDMGQTMRCLPLLLHAPQAFLELALGGNELREGCGEMLHLLIQLLLDLRELLYTQAVKAHCERPSASIQTAVHWAQYRRAFLTLAPAR